MSQAPQYIEPEVDLDLTDEEIIALEYLSDEQIQAYHDACSSYEAMKAYLDNPDTPASTKAILDLSGWAEAKPE